MSLSRKTNFVEIIQHIKSQHINLVRHDLPLIAQLLEISLREASTDRTEIEQVRTVFLDFQSKLGTHLHREARSTYPLILRHESGEATLGQTVESSLAMINEHHDLMDLLCQIRQLTHQYRPDYQASPTVKLLFEKLHRAEIETLRLFDLEMTHAYADFTA